MNRTNRGSIKGGRWAKVLRGTEARFAMVTAEFEGAAIVQKHDIFLDVPDPSSALKYGTQGLSAKARKPA